MILVYFNKTNTIRKVVPMLIGKMVLRTILKYDKKSLRTIPIIFGEKKAKYISLFTLFIAGVISIIQYTQ